MTDPLWYMGELYDTYLTLMDQAEHDDQNRHAIKYAIRSYFAERLRQGRVALADSGPDADAERKPVDTVVIHHTSGAAALYASLDYLDAVQLLRIYVPAHRADPVRAGKPLWSGHMYKGRQVFWGYHWFIFEDGRAERILPDTAIGRHSGNWDTNTRSIGICLAGNFMHQPPNEAMLQTLQRIIREQYGSSDMHIIGHRDVRDTTCPGDTFDAWKPHLGP